MDDSEQNNNNTHINSHLELENNISPIIESLLWARHFTYITLFSIKESTSIISITDGVETQKSKPFARSRKMARVRCELRFDLRVSFLKHMPSERGCS